MKTELKQKKVNDIAVSRGGKNVFEDLGFPKSEAAELKVKAELTMQIRQRVRALGLTQIKAAGQLGVSQPDVSKLLNGRHAGFTVERLMSLLTALEVDIDIIVKPKVHHRPARPGTVRVMEGSAA